MTLIPEQGTSASASTFVRPFVSSQPLANTMDAASERTRSPITPSFSCSQPSGQNASPASTYGFAGYANLKNNRMDLANKKRPRLSSTSLSESQRDGLSPSSVAAVKQEIRDGFEQVKDDEEDEEVVAFGVRVRALRENSLEARIKALEEANAQLIKDNVAAHKLVEEIADIVTGCQYALVKRACKINLFALFMYGHVYDDRRHQTVYAGSRAFSLQDVNMACLFSLRLPKTLSGPLREALQKRELNLLLHWYEKNDRRLYHYLCARQTSIANVFVGAHGKLSPPHWFPGHSDAVMADEAVKQFKAKVMVRYPMLRVFDEHDRACWIVSKVSETFTGPLNAKSSSEPCVLEDVTMNTVSGPTLQMTIDERRRSDLLRSNLDKQTLDDVCRALASPCEKVDLSNNCKTVTAAMVRRTIEVSLRRQHDVQFWNTIKANFSDFFAGGLTSYDAGEELDLFSLMCPPWNDSSP